MIVELRIYRCLPGRLPALLRRCVDHALPLWQRHGIRQGGFWTTLVGASDQELTYMILWESLAERTAKWHAFTSDPDWLRAHAASEADGRIVASVRNQLLVPTEFSKPAAVLDQPPVTRPSIG